MAGKNPLGREGNRSGHPPRRLGGDSGAGISRAEEIEVRVNGKGDDDSRERWFCQDNSRAEIHTLTRLEDDLNSTLLFKHGGGRRASQLCITRILMGCLSQGRMALGKAVEVFAKIQWRDIMRSMVKLHDLVDLVEPPWRGMVEVSSSRWQRDEVMELDEAMENQDKEATEAQRRRLVRVKQIWVWDDLYVCLCFSNIFINMVYMKCLYSPSYMSYE